MCNGKLAFIRNAQTGKLLTETRLMCAGRRGCILGWFAKKPDRRRTEKRQKSGPAEDVDVSEQSGLLQQASVKESHRAGTRGCGAKMVPQVGRNLTRALLEDRIGR